MSANNWPLVAIKRAKSIGCGDFKIVLVCGHTIVEKGPLQAKRKRCKACAYDRPPGPLYE